VAQDAQPGVRVRVRFAGRLVDGWLLERADASSTPARSAQLAAVVSAEQVATPGLLALARAVADRCAGTLPDVLRLALPPRHARVEAEPAPEPAAPPTRPEPGPWERYDTGPAFLAALADGHSPRAVWSALPGPSWPEEVALAVRATAAAAVAPSSWCPTRATSLASPRRSPSRASPRRR
jgi:primosomal protein N' (replication factor Y)